MMKKKLIILLMLLLIPSLASSVGYQVSCRGVVLERDSFNTVWNYLSQIETIGTAARFRDQGDYLRPALSDPNQTATYSLDMLYRLASPSSRDALYDYLLDRRLLFDQNQPGYVERHDCYGDERKPCQADTGESWGGVE